VNLWLEIVVRELAMLGTLLAFGIGPASFLGRRFEAASRLAIAPALGLCLSTCVFTTLIWFTAARNTYWLVPFMAIASVAVALWRASAGASIEHDRTARSALRLPRRGDALALAVVCVVVAAPLSYTLHERHTVGPTSFVIPDAAGYTEMADGAVGQSIRQSVLPAARLDNPSQMGWTNYAHSVQNIDAAPLSANLNEFLGLEATDTQTPYMIAFLVVDALGAFAAVRYVTRKPSWAAPLAGVLFAGPLFLQLLADGSQAAICGIALMLPIATVGAETLRERRFANLVLLALLAAGLMALYPLYVPGVAVAAALVLLACAVRSLLHGRLGRQALLSALARVTVVLALTIVFNVVSFTRNLLFWHEAAVISMAGKPVYDLPISVLPGWLLETRQFYLLTPLAHASLYQVIIGVILPAAFIVVIVAGIRRWRQAWIAVSVILVFAALAEYTNVTKGCSYCVDRNLLPVAPLSIALLALGVAALASAPSRWLRWVGIAVAVAAIAGTANQTRIERVLFANSSYFLETGNRTLLSHLPAHAGPLSIEGYGVDLHHSVAELALVYTLASERNDGQVSSSNEHQEYAQFNALNQGVPALDEKNPINSDLDPSYRYVLTRFGGVQTARRTIARAGPLALEERRSALDVMLLSGIRATLTRFDTQGLPAVVAPLHLLVLGGGSAPAWILLRFQTVPQSRVTVPVQPGVRSQTTPTSVTACVRATGRAPVRQATLTMQGELIPAIARNEEFASVEPEPPRGIQLVAMRAIARCPPASAR
jgi:hypothetical protein